MTFCISGMLNQMCSLVNPNCVHPEFSLNDLLFATGRSVVVIREHGMRRLPSIGVRNEEAPRPIWAGVIASLVGRLLAQAESLRFGPELRSGPLGFISGARPARSGRRGALGAAQQLDHCPRGQAGWVGDVGYHEAF
jgi:hypothetical protein